jgi:hypothetical protein
MSHNRVDSFIPQPASRDLIIWRNRAPLPLGEIATVIKYTLAPSSLILKHARRLKKR